ncbi:hypothetical protein Fmac_010742 [Flemingia macrophylla]|uniref:Uncharacterized protein n=1 Tax=Flemingia macrophylla TaxID=520843 RepID=A0ABD1MKG3_9FABA
MGLYHSHNMPREKRGLREWKVKQFPFEICALEVLEAICSLLDTRTREVETPGYVALDELTSKVCDCYSHTVSWASGFLLKLVGHLSHLTPDLESPVNKRSSEGSHMPDGGNSPATI